jgi:type I restriction enzyme, S subunit
MNEITRVANLPRHDGWSPTTLGNVIRLEYGKPLDRSERNSEGLHPVYGANGEKDRTNKFYRDERTIIVGRKGSAGELTLSEKKYWPLDVTYFVEFDRQSHDLQFLFYLLATLDLPSLAKGIKPGINRNDVYALPVAMPLLREQHRIVALLDEAFEGIATAKANAEKNLQSARELFGRNLSEVFSAKDRLVALSELASDITDGDHMPPPKSNAGIPFITISNIVKRTRTINFESTFLVSPDYFASLKANRKPRRGDVLYTVTGATLGIPVLVDDDTEFCFQRHIALIRPRLGVSSEWLHYAMAAPQVFAQATHGATGAAQKTVSLTLLRSMKVPCHSESEQASIVAHLDKLFGQTQRLEDLYGARLILLNELKNALLHQAFSGAL